MSQLPYHQSELYSAFYDTDPSPIVEFIQWLAASHNLSTPLRILDMGCGPGRMLCEYAQLGWETVGMEPHPDYLAQALLIAQAHKDISVTAGGFADLTAEEKFDIIAAVNGPFYYLLKIEDRVDALRRMFHALKPGGILFLDMANFLWIIHNFRERTETTATVNGQNVTLITHHSIDFYNCIFTAEEEFSWHDAEAGRVKVTETHKFAIFGLPELRYLIEQQGFNQIQTYNSYKSRQSEKLTGSRLMISAQKP